MAMSNVWGMVSKVKLWDNPQRRFLKIINAKDEQVHEVCKRLQNGDRVVDIAKDIGSSLTFVKGIRNQKVRKDITSKYDFSKIKTDNDDL